MISQHVWSESDPDFTNQNYFIKFSHTIAMYLSPNKWYNNTMGKYTHTKWTVPRSSSGASHVYVRFCWGLSNQPITVSLFLWHFLSSPPATASLNVPTFPTAWYFLAWSIKPRKGGPDKVTRNTEESILLFLRVVHLWVCIIWNIIFLNKIIWNGDQFIMWGRCRLHGSTYCWFKFTNKIFVSVDTKAIICIFHRTTWQPDSQLSLSQLNLYNFVLIKVKFT